MKLATSTPVVEEEVPVVTGDSPVEEQAPVFSAQNPYEIPLAWRTYKSAQLSVGHVNAIMQDAYANKIETGDSTVPDFGGAKERFELDHEIVDGFWVNTASEVQS